MSQYELDLRCCKGRATQADVDIGVATHLHLVANHHDDSFANYGTDIAEAAEAIRAKASEFQSSEALVQLARHSLQAVAAGHSGESNW